jgi:undecaprenyl-diphosphatase
LPNEFVCVFPGATTISKRYGKSIPGSNESAVVAGNLIDVNPSKNHTKIGWTLNQIQCFDCYVSKWLADLSLPSFWFKSLRFFVRIGDGWLWLPVVLFISVIEPHHEFYSISLQCLIALAVSMAFYWPLKLGVRRLRPFHWMPGISAQVPPLDKFSFPSGHTMHNLAIGLTVAHFFPSTFWPLAFIPFAFGFFRIYFGVHFLSDVLAGGFLGICCFQIGKWVCS